MIKTETMKNLIGRKVIGFKFEDEIIGYDSYMNKHIGEIGIIACSDEGWTLIDIIDREY